MGGYGSGRQGGRPTVEASIRLELPLLKAMGYLRRGAITSWTLSWSCRGRHTGSISLRSSIGVEGRSYLVAEFMRDGEDVQQRIELVSVPMRFGGERLYAVCPASGRRCTTLVLPNGGRRFASVKAWRLPYASQNEDALGRAHRSIDKARRRLEGLSKYARRPTVARLRERIYDGEEVIESALAGAWEKISGFAR